ncbi:MAG TPA: SMC-Scp complex subunit ScpB [Euryarchaeota archaeon]|nr:MAG: SMC-Scp complex subunit ScpB [Thermoplasmata archaeon]HHD16171.1 SMC-Scp complex subunit ScpB [Euryarchaeota archaeon]
MTDEREDPPEHDTPDDDERGESAKVELPHHLLVEAALFSAGKPISLEDISSSTGVELALVRLYLKKLMSTYSRRETSLEIIKAGKKYSLRVKEPYVDRISSLAAPEVNPKLLKTAALIAYHQPMKQSELVEMYGSKIYDHVRELISLGLVRARKDGSTKILTTTHRFSEVFGISSVSKKKVRGHVKERVLKRISRMTLDRYEGGGEGAAGEAAAAEDVDGDEAGEGSNERQE